MADPAVAQMVVQQYPWVAALLGIPEVSQLILDSVDPNIGFDANTFQAKLYQTNWWRTTPEAQRQQIVQVAIDPATAQADINSYNSQLRQMAYNLGLSLNDAQVTWLTAYGMGSGYSVDSQIMRDQLYGLVNHGDVLAGIGTAGAAKNQVEGLVRGQWFRSIADLGWLTKAGLDVATGKTTIESINAQLASQAWNMYPHLRQQITEGQTLADIFNPYRQIIASELEYGSVEQVDMNNPEWSKLLQWRDPTNNEVRLPTQSEVMTFARDRPQWWQTSKGRQTDANMASTILAAFGRRAA